MTSGALRRTVSDLDVPLAFGALWVALPIAWCGLPEGGMLETSAVFGSLLAAAAAAFVGAAFARARFQGALEGGGDEESAVAGFPRTLSAFAIGAELVVALPLLALLSDRLRGDIAEWPSRYGPAIAFATCAFSIPRHRWARARAAAEAESMGLLSRLPWGRGRRPFGDALLKWFALVAGMTALPLAARTVGLFEYGSAAAFTVDAQILATVGLTFGAAAVIASGVRRRLARRVADIDAIPSSASSEEARPFVEECIEMGRAIREIGRRYAESCESQARLIETRSRTREKKARVFASMSHDLRGPLNSIVGFSDLLLKGIDGQLLGPQRETVAEISRESERLLALIGDILDTAKMEAGRFEIERARVSCEEIAVGCVDGSARIGETKEVRISADVEPGIPHLFVDRERVMGLLIGLLGRAADNMRGGSLVIGARRVSSLEEGRDYALFEILDERGEVDVVWREHALDVFASLEGVTIASEDGGLALGLALVQRILKLHGGELDVGSSGARAVFAVALPLDHLEGEG